MKYSSGGPSCRPRSLVGSGHQVVKRGTTPWLMKNSSPSAVDELEHALGKPDFDRLLSTATAVAIGPTTARALTDRGYTPALAESATLHGLAHTTHRLLHRSEAQPR